MVSVSLNWLLVTSKTSTPFIRLIKLILLGRKVSVDCWRAILSIPLLSLSSFLLISYLLLSWCQWHWRKVNTSRSLFRSRVQLRISTPGRGDVLFLIHELSWIISLRSHHGSYINWTMCAVHIITFPSVHYVAVLRLLVVYCSANASYSVSRTNHVNRAMGLLQSIVLENTPLSSVPAHKGWLSSSTWRRKRLIVWACHTLARSASLIFRHSSWIYLQISVLNLFSFWSALMVLHFGFVQKTINFYYFIK